MIVFNRFFPTRCGRRRSFRSRLLLLPQPDRPPPHVGHAPAAGDDEHLPGRDHVADNPKRRYQNKVIVEAGFKGALVIFLLCIFVGIWNGRTSFQIMNFYFLSKPSKVTANYAKVPGYFFVQL